MPRIEDVTDPTLPLLERGLRALAADLRDPFTATTTSLRQALFSDRPACHGLIALSGDALSGVTLFSPMFSTVAGHAGVYVSDLWVAPDARGTALAKRLLAQSARRGRTLWDACYLRLVSYDDNPRAGAFYGKLGFDPHRGETTLRLFGAAFDDLVRTA